MKVIFVGSELTPIAKVGGLGDVMGALPKALRKLGVEVSIIIPCYGFIPKENLKLVADQIEVPLASTTETISLFATVLPHSDIPVYLVENKNYWGHGAEPYFEQSAIAGAEQEIRRFTFFSKAVFKLIENRILTADIVHANDWHTGALVALMARRKHASTKTIFTIHNLGNQGKWNSAEIDAWFFENGEEKIFQKIGNDYNFIAEGITNADFVTTVSESYAKEILTKEYGNGLENILSLKKRSLFGILNGIDYEFFNPENDKFIYQCFTANTVADKLKNKLSLEKDLNLEISEKAPLFGLVSRLTEQKGIDVVIDSLNMFAGKHDARFVFLGRGNESYEKSIADLENRFQGKIKSIIGFDESLAHKIYAASDFFLMPSRFEPSGLGQMIAMRYGSVPIVRETGGLRDSVKNMKTGIVFKSASYQDFSISLEIAVQMFAGKHRLYENIQNRGMKENFSFSVSAEKYLKLYKKILRKNILFF
jgi:starch synthase